MEFSQISPENSEIKNITNSTGEMANETDVINDTINTETAPTSNDSDSKIYSIKTECFFEGLKIPNDDSQKSLIDFEELIDLSRAPNDIEETIQYIKEFENVLSNFETPEVCVNDVEDILNLDDIVNDILENGTGNIDLETLTIPDLEQSNEDRTSNTENAIENMPETNENVLQTPESADIDNPDSKTLTNKEDTSKEPKPDEIYVISDETQSISSDGYNSSDFEFITEAEAKMDGYVINFSTNETNIAKNKSFDEVESSQSDECRDYASQIINENRYLTGHVNGSYELVSQEEKYSKYYKKNNAILGENGSSSPTRNVLDPGEGPSWSNGPILDYSDRNYRQNHVVPEDEGYLDLFQGQYDPVLPFSDIILLENKSIRPSPMNSRYEGIGFDNLIIWRNCQPEDSSEEEYGDEAKECLNKILSMYPDENRKPKRRRH